MFHVLQTPTLYKYTYVVEKVLLPFVSDDFKTTISIIYHDLPLHLVLSWCGLCKLPGISFILFLISTLSSELWSTTVKKECRQDVIGSCQLWNIYDQSGMCSTCLKWLLPNKISITKRPGQNVATNLYDWLQGLVKRTNSCTAIGYRALSRYYPSRDCSSCPAWEIYFFLGHLPILLLGLLFG